MSDSAFISVRNLRKSFGQFEAVKGISLDVAQGEFFGLLGPSGCGKTTLMRMLAGFEAPSSGEIYIDGQPMAATPPHRRPVNMVFQNYAIFPHLTVRQNIVFGLRKARLRKTELNRLADEALEMIKLQGYGSRASHELSGGQRQRVALARALIKKPKVLLLDEPLGALDKKLREQMQLELRDLQRSVGITFVFVTHDQEEALTMSDRIAVMSSGDICQVGAPADLYEAPRTHFVADFIGSMNFFDGIVQAMDDGSTVIRCDTLGDIRTTNKNLVVRAGDPIVVGIRPENFRLSSDIDGDPTNSVEGQLGHSAYLGDRAHLYVHTGQGGKPISVAVQNLDGRASLVAKTGQKIWLRWSDDAPIMLAR